jgi:hypothetical protein
MRRLAGYALHGFVAFFMLNTIDVVAQAPNALFVDLPPDMESRSLKATVENPSVIRYRYAAINQETVASVRKSLTRQTSDEQTIWLNLFDDTSFYVVIDEIGEMGDGDVSVWQGHIEGMPESEVTMTTTDGVMVGNIRTRDAQDNWYQIRYAGDEVQLIKQIDQTQFPEEAEPVQVPMSFSPTDVTIAADDGSIIDVMVVYTPAARAAAGGTAAMNSLIALAFTETNTGYANSGAIQRINLVHSSEVNYTEAGFSTDLSRLRTTNDGYMDEIHNLRDAYSADMVSLFIRDGAYCGMAYLMTGVSNSFAAYAFSAVNYSCATGYYSFAHELGHNMGSHHDAYVTSYSGAYPYSQGYVNLTLRGRTIMAYNSECSANGFSCSRLNYWSTPNTTYNSGTIGDAASAHNQRSLDNTRVTVANWRSSSSPPVNPIPTPPIVIGPIGSVADINPTYSWNAVAFAVTYEVQVFEKGGRTVHQQWYTSAEANCDSGSVCSVSPQVMAAINAGGGGGDQTWQVRAQNVDGVNGAWSATTEFSSNTSASMAVPTLIFPSTWVSDISQTYTWNSVAGTMVYELVILDTNNSIVFSDWYGSGGAGCQSGGVCAATPTIMLSNANYTWQARAIDGMSKMSEWSAPMSFRMNSSLLRKPYVLSPNGSVGTATPRYFWHRVSGGVNYQLEIFDNGGASLFTAWYTPAVALCVDDAGCEATPALPLAEGDYSWSVRGQDSSGVNGLWSDPLSFTIKFLAKPTLISPTGAIAVSTPTYSWVGDPEALQYKWEVLDSDGSTSATAWYHDADVGCTGGGTCSLSPSLSLPDGNFTWRVRSEKSGYNIGPWSDPMAFAVSASTGLSKLTLISPNGVETTKTPVYSWNSVPGVNMYEWENIYDEYYTEVRLFSPATAGCAGGGVCAVTPSWDLANRNYTWRARVRDGSGNIGPWSDIMAFSANFTFTETPILISPNGIETTVNPTLTWNSVDGGFFYSWEIIDSDGATVFSSLCTATSAGCSGGGQCAITSGANLANGDYTWRLRASDNFGSYGQFSNETAFSVNTGAAALDNPGPPDDEEQNNPPPDKDGDGVSDNSDNCPDVSNADQADSDRNGVGDACEGAPPPPGIF